MKTTTLLVASMTLLAAVALAAPAEAHVGVCTGSDPRPARCGLPVVPAPVHLVVCLNDGGIPTVCERPT